MSSPIPRSHTTFAAFALASIGLFWAPLHQWLSLSLADQRYSHLILIPVISAFFLYLERRRIFSPMAFRPGVGLLFLAASVAIYALLALRVVQPSPNYLLSAVMLSIVLVWVAAFAVCYGVYTFRAALFPLLLLLLIVPVPFAEMDKIIAVLQRGAAEATYLRFKLAGVPMFRHGVTFELPGIGIEVAAECSSIHSAWALFITGLLLGHLFLKSLWTKICLSVLTIPVAAFTNAVRIVILWFLGTHVDPRFLTGRLHHNGGIVFSLISLSILMTCFFFLRKTEANLVGHG